MEPSTSYYDGEDTTLANLFEIYNRKYINLSFFAITDLDKQQVIIEIARLLDGSQITNQALKLAREMRKRSHSTTAT